MRAGLKAAREKRAPVIDRVEARLVSSTEYPVEFLRGAFRGERLLENLRRLEPERRQRCLLIVDAGAAAARPELLAEAQGWFRRRFGALDLAAPPLLVEGGASARGREGLAGWLRGCFLKAGLDRRAHVLALGGCSLLDAAGFAAATFRGGVRLTRLPSTVLAQCGAGVAAGCAVAEHGRPGLLGSARAPFAVLVDYDLLDALDERTRRAGMSEALRAGLLFEPALFHWIAEHAGRLAAGERGVLETLVRWSARLHLEPWSAGTEPGGEPLLFGCWAAWGLDACAPGRLRRGEALALGIAIDSLLSVEQCGLPEPAAQAVLTVLAQLGFRLWDEAFELKDERGRLRVLEGLRELADEQGGEPELCLLRELGRAVPFVRVRPEDAAQAVRGLKRRPRRHG